MLLILFMNPPELEPELDCVVVDEFPAEVTGAAVVVVSAAMAPESMATADRAITTKMIRFLKAFILIMF